MVAFFDKAAEKRHSSFILATFLKFHNTWRNFNKSTFGYNQHIISLHKNSKFVLSKKTTSIQTLLKSTESASGFI